MPVGTAGTVKAHVPRTGAATGADIILGNTYHLMLRPGAERVARLGGLHHFMGWHGPILTDSGGFQVMSLSQACARSTRRASPSSRTSTARRHVLTPERSMEIQRLLGADILMQLDECVALPRTRERGRAGDGAVAALGASARARRFGDAAGPGAVRHRAGRRRSRRCASESAEALQRHRLRRLRHRRARGGRGAGR